MGAASRLFDTYAYLACPLLLKPFWFIIKPIVRPIALTAASGGRVPYSDDTKPPTSKRKNESMTTIVIHAALGAALLFWPNFLDLKKLLPDALNFLKGDEEKNCWEGLRLS